MSVDTHKFGLADKGTSVVLYASPEHRMLQFTSIVDWSGGLYISPTMVGYGCLTWRRWLGTSTSAGRPCFAAVPLAECRDGARELPPPLLQPPPMPLVLLLCCGGGCCCCCCRPAAGLAR